MSLNYLVNGSEMQHGAQVIQIKIIHTMVVIFHMCSFLYINTLILNLKCKKYLNKIMLKFWHFFHLRLQILSLVNREKNLNCQKINKLLRLMMDPKTNYPLSSGSNSTDKWMTSWSLWGHSRHLKTLWKYQTRQYKGMPCLIFYHH